MIKGNPLSNTMSSTAFVPQHGMQLGWVPPKPKPEWVPPKPKPKPEPKPEKKQDPHHEQMNAWFDAGRVELLKLPFALTDETKKELERQAEAKKIEIASLNEEIYYNNSFFSDPEALQIASRLNAMRKELRDMEAELDARLPVITAPALQQYPLTADVHRLHNLPIPPCTKLHYNTVNPGYYENIDELAAKDIDYESQLPQPLVVTIPVNH